MKITILQSDSNVGVDGAFRQISLAGLDPTIHAVQFNTVLAKGHIEFLADLDPRPANQPITDFTPYQVFLDRWTAAAPPPPPPPIDQSDMDNIAKRDKAILLCVAQVGGLTNAQIKTMFKQKYDSLP